MPRSRIIVQVCFQKYGIFTCDCWLHLCVSFKQLGPNGLCGVMCLCRLLGRLSIMKSQVSYDFRRVRSQISGVCYCVWSVSGSKRFFKYLFDNELNRCSWSCKIVRIIHVLKRLFWNLKTCCRSLLETQSTARQTIGL